MIKTKAQVATEFLLITGFFLLIIVPTVFYFYGYAQEAATDVESSKVESIGNSIVDTAESVFYYGRYSRLTLNVDLPNGISNLNVTCSETVDEEQTKLEKCKLYITMLKNELFFPSNVPLIYEPTDEQAEKDIVQGKHSIILETKHDVAGDYVDMIITK